jgi:hypothetical protein
MKNTDNGHLAAADARSGEQFVSVKKRDDNMGIMDRSPYVLKSIILQVSLMII